jgi:hypothetical protein
LEHVTSSLAELDHVAVIITAMAGHWSHHLRQVRAPRAALVVQIPGLLARAVGRDLAGTLEQFGIHPVALDKTVEGITAASAAFLALMLRMPSKMIAPSRASELLLVDAFDEIFDDNFQRLDRR